jgi:hypothetical protein
MRRYDTCSPRFLVGGKFALMTRLARMVASRFGTDPAKCYFLERRYQHH